MQQEYAENKWCGNEMSTVSVGSYKPNTYGLFDMHGNVWEWTQDCRDNSFQGSPYNSSLWSRRAICGRFVLRGGSWNNMPSHILITSRSGGEYNSRQNSYGFRLAMD